MVEPVFNTVAGVHRTALVGVTRDGVTYPVLCVEREMPDYSHDTRPRFVRRSWDELLPELRIVAAQSEHTSGIELFLEHPHFPVDVRHNSKIFREKLARWADRKLGKRWNPKAHAPQPVSSEAPPS
jgi:hypothetical protein